MGAAILAVLIAGTWLVSSSTDRGAAGRSPVTGSSRTAGASGTAKETIAGADGSARATPATVLVSPAGHGHLPTLTSQSLVGGPSLAAWYLADDRHVQLLRWRADGGGLAPLAMLETWPAPAADTPVERTIVVAPDGRSLAFREAIGGAEPRERLRVFDEGGRLLWSLPVGESYPWALVWSADGSSLAMAATHLLVVEIAGGREAAVHVVGGAGTPSSGAPLVPLGFSADARRLYVYPSTTFYPDYWTKLARVDLSTSALTPVDALPGSGSATADRLVPSNGTTQLDAVEGSTGRVLIVSAAGSVIRTGSQVAPLALTPSEGGTITATVWGPDGSLVLAESNGTRPAAALELRTIRPDATGANVDPPFALPSADVSATLVGVRDGCALVGLASATGDSGITGNDEYVLVRLADGATDVSVAPGRSADGTGLHFAGWLP